MPVRLLDGPESPAEHCRTALMLLDNVDRAFRTFGLLLTADEAIEFYGPLAAARSRLWQAVEMLEHADRL